MTPAAARQRTGRYCSQACAWIGGRKPASFAEVLCGTCGVVFSKRKDHLKQVNYCSRPCSGAAKRVEGAKWRDASRIKGYMRAYGERNRERLLEQAREWAAKNPEKRSAMRRTWAHKNRVALAADANARYALKRRCDAATFQDWLDILASSYGKCAHCGSTERIECDHIVPISKGGQHVKENLQPLCRSCNATKGAKLVAAVTGMEIVES